ncbi:serine/threonine-protein kinase [Actinophytocola glycyrrhizae]|uniref:non-specific serine/threonine protein kinase n=1 Tax=Actinophytocola glycyrrhizae TaxID=2044873 RepID=A0ABV9S5E6_9PSEU
MTDATTGEGHLVAGRYRLDNRIGTGAMGVVWQGHDERLNRPVAVKTLLQEPGDPPAEAAAAVARCLREGRIAARLHHPNATTVFDVVDEDGVPCLVMEYLPSRSLATAIAETSALPPEEVAAIGAQVASALVAAHEAGIVHRDITPGNVLLGEDGSVKLTDFGISHASDDVTVTRTGLIAGTPAYMAPEVALGTDPTTASDVFSLGSTLYAAVEGEPPFGLAPNTLALLHTVAGGRINPPRRAGPLTDVLTALLVADPQARPTAEQARDLLAAVGEGTVQVPPVVAAGEAAAAPAREPAGEDAVRTQVVDGPGTRVEPAAAHGVHRPLAAAGVLLVAMVAAGIWLLGGRDSVAPAEERSPADGAGHSQTAPTRTTAEVEAVREPIDIDEVPAADTRPPPPGTTTEGAAPEPTTEPKPPVSTAPPSATTTEDAPDPTTTPGTQPGTTTSATTPTTTPTTTTSVTTPPPTSDEESDEEKAEESPAASGSATPVDRG